MKHCNLKEINEIFAEWDGSSAEISKVHSDDGHFVLGLFKKNHSLTSGKGVVGVTLFYCGYISGLTRWEGCKIQCKESTFTNKYWQPEGEILGYELFDSNVDFSLHCYGGIKFGNPEVLLPERE